MSLLNRLLELQKENNPESPYRDVQSKLDELKRKYSKHLDVGCYAYYGYIKLEWLLALKTAFHGMCPKICNILKIELGEAF
jgi:hypothetical protein